MSPRWIVLVDKVTISIVFDFEPFRILPIIKDLTPQDMSSNPPNAFSAFLCQPMMADELRIKVIDLVRAVMDESLPCARWSALHEKTVEISVLLSKIEMHERDAVDVVELWEV